MKTVFSFKNFRNHMGIKDNITLAGIMKRYTRKYPRVYALAKGTTVLGGVYFIMMSLFPGTSMPLQKDIKLSLFALYAFNHYLALVSQYKHGTITSSLLSQNNISSSSTK